MGRAVARGFHFHPLPVSHVLKGPAAAVVVVRQLGGSAGGFTMKVAGVRSWRVSEEAVLFLRPSMANDDTMAVVGLCKEISILSGPHPERRGQATALPECIATILPVMPAGPIAERECR